MASFRERNGKWRAEVFVSGERTSKSFDSEHTARTWAGALEKRLKRQAELKEMMALGQGIPGFPKRIMEAMHDTPLGYEEIVQAAIPTSVVCGIYFLIREDRIVYVGQSTNVLRRVARHIDDGKEFDRFTITPCAADDLDRMERTYITALCPDENMTFGVPGKSRSLSGQKSINLLDGDKSAAVHA